MSTKRGRIPSDKKLEAALKRRLLDAIEGEDKSSGAEVKALCDALRTLQKESGELRAEWSGCEVKFINTEGAEV